MFWEQLYQYLPPHPPPPPPPPDKMYFVYSFKKSSLAVERLEHEIYYVVKVWVSLI